MNKGTIIALSAVGGLVLIGLILVMWYFSTYNGLVSSDESVNQRWADVEVTYQRRADLIPNLIATVQGAANFESNTQTQIAELRTQAIAARDAFNQAQASGDQEAAIAAAQQVDAVATRFSGLNINVENYPQLKATANFQSLQDELAGTENRVAVARTRYNEEVQKYNVKVRVFPSSIVASMAGFERKTPFEAASGAEVAPTVSFE